MNQLTHIWLERLALLEIAFQPIVHMHTARLYGVEALLRNVKAAGFETIFALFDAAYNENILYAFDLALRQKALEKFTQIHGYENIKLFYNLDNRLFEMSDFSTGNTQQIVESLNLKQENICFEISERYEFSSDRNLERLISHYKDEDFCVAIDDFGTGYSGYKLLYQFTPDVIKIDRFFLTGIERDLKKKSMVRSITQLAVKLGIKVIAEGVETKEELLTCKEIGCHLVQGYYVQHPTLRSDEILLQYQDIKSIFHAKKRSAENSLEKFIYKAETLPCDSSMDEILSFFQKHTECEYLPMVNKYNEPMGVIEEKEVRQYLYSPFGHALLSNQNFQKSKLKYLVKPYACVDMHTDVDTLIDIYVQNITALGVVVTKNSQYYGFLSSRAIVNIINELNIIHARDQNPLTQLPGNKRIDDFMFKALGQDQHYMMCYLDLDNFKAFNDVYGFRNGDRVLKLFADILRKRLANAYFIGHIGGDDFFVATSRDNYEEAINTIRLVIEQFSHDVKGFYSMEDRENGYIVSKNREGEAQRFDLLSASASLVALHAKSKARSLEFLNSALSMQKKHAKSRESHLCVSTLL